MLPTIIITGGHHTSALEVAIGLRKTGYRIVWFGHRHSMWGDRSDSAEFTDVSQAGFEFRDLKAGKLFRTFNPRKLIRLPLGFIQAWLWLKEIHPIGIVSFGGYLAVPTVIAGRVLGIPSITHEQTVVSGWANLILSRLVKKVAVSWPDSLSHYPPDKAIYVGLPLRAAILKLANRPKTHHSQIKQTIYITCGKQGSHKINQVIFSALDKLLEKYNLIHQTGSSSLNSDLDHAQSLARPGYQVFGYGQKQALSAFAQADLVVGRSGAHICYEIAATNLKSVLIPIPWVSHQEQLRNAQLLAKYQRAIVLPESELSAASLLTAIELALKLSPQPFSVPLDATKKLINLIIKEFK